MKGRWTILALAALVILAAGAASAQAPLITVDENGNGSFNGKPIPWTIGQDIGPGGFPNALLYHLLPAGTQWVVGDLILLEPSAGGVVVLSDVVRFNPDGSLVFYSDREATDLPPFDLADVGFPGSFWDNILRINEVGPEGGPNGAIYQPTPNQPGFFGDPATGAGPIYTIISDVPEPSALLGVLSGVIGMAGLALRRRA
jgi:hypothetical protein